MANEYYPLAKLKNALGIKPDDTSRDEDLQDALTAASRGIDDRTGRRFYLDETATARTYNPARRVSCNVDGEEGLIVDDIGSTSGLVVEIGSGTSFTPVGAFETEPENATVQALAVTILRLPLGATWRPAIGIRVRVTARWGWPAVPDQVVSATRIQAARLFKRKDSPEGVMGNAEWGVIRVARIDPDVEALISHLILPGIG